MFLFLESLKLAGYDRIYPSVEQIILDDVFLTKNLG